MVIKYPNVLFVFILLGFLHRKTTLFFLHRFLSRHRVLRIPFAKNLRRLLLVFSDTSMLLLPYVMPSYANTDKEPDLNNLTMIYSLILFSLFTAWEHYN